MSGRGSGGGRDSGRGGGRDGERHGRGGRTPAGRQLYPAAPGEWGTLRGLREALAGGRRLDDPADPCLPGSVEICLALEYRLPAGVPVPRGATSGLELELYAEQCRHVPEADAASPFEDAACVEPECHRCVALGKLEVRDDRLERGRYGFDELEDSFADDGRTYELEVLDSTTKEGGEETTCAAFRLLRDGRETLPVCEVTVDGGPHHRTRGIEPPSTRTRGELCTEQVGTHGGRPHRPAISSLAVSVCPDADGNGGDRQ